MKYLLVLSLTFISSVQAATIAVIDGGLDFTHPQLSEKMWTNSRRDFNGEFPQVRNGWNFALESNEIFDFSLKNNLPKNMDKIKNFVWYGDYAHGTHVAGIIVKESSHRLIGMTRDGANEETHRVNISASLFTNAAAFFEALVEGNLKREDEKYRRMGRFIQTHPVDVANCSFGIPYKTAKLMVTPMFIKAYQRPPTVEEAEDATLFFQNIMQNSFEKLTSQASNTLFVLSAGNDGVSNDVYLRSPLNLDLPNAISVAATNGEEALASFSNFGVHSVDVAAPGVNILSAAPGLESLRMSGTSMAAPFVSRIAGLVKDANAKLSAGQIKKILMETVEKKTFLKHKVRSGGIVNEKRALRAAVLSRTHLLAEAIARAETELPQRKNTKSARIQNLQKELNLVGPALSFR